MDDFLRELQPFTAVFRLERELLEKRLGKARKSKRKQKEKHEQTSTTEDSGNRLELSLEKEEQEKWMKEKGNKELEQETDLPGACAATSSPDECQMNDPEVDEFKMEALRTALLKFCAKLTTISPHFWQQKVFDDKSETSDKTVQPRRKKNVNKTVTLKSPKHSVNLMQGMNALRRQNILCDLTLIVEERRFQVHRSVLAAFSGYFRDLLNGPPEDTDDSEIILEGLSSHGLELVINFIYTAEIDLSIQNVPKVLEATTCLEMPSIIDICSDFLKGELLIENCVEILNIGTSYNVSDLRVFAEGFILANFKEITDKGVFQELNDRQMNDCLKSNKLAMYDETEVFQTVVRWLQLTPIRLPYSGKLMRNVRLSLIPPDDLVDKVQSHGFMMNDPACNSLLIDAFKYHATPHRQPCMQSMSSMLRSSNELFITVGGLRDNGATTNVECLNTFNGATYHLSQAPSRLVDHSVATLANFMYVVGGQTSGSPGGEHSLATVYRYDPRINTWVTLPTMMERRSNFHLCVIANKLYAACGWKGRHERTRSVEYYDPQKNQWSFVAPYPVSAVAPAGAVFDGILYISGGYGGQYSNAVNAYNPTTNTWEARMSMQTARAWHSMVTVRSKIYAIGGNCKDGNGKRIDVLNTECYNPLSDQWHTLPSDLPSGCSVTNAVVMKGNIYVVGGYEWKTKQSKRSVLCYYVDDDRWGWKSDMVNTLNGMACCTLILPQDVPNDPRFQLDVE